MTHAARRVAKNPVSLVFQRFADVVRDALIVEKVPVIIGLRPGSDRDLDDISRLGLELDLLADDIALLAELPKEPCPL